MSLDEMNKLSEVQDSYFFRLPHAYIIADYVWPGVIMSARRIQDINEMQFDENDVVIASYPKSGTTWMAELVSAINYFGNTEELKKLRQDARVPWLELDTQYWWVQAFYKWNKLFSNSNTEIKDNRCHTKGTKYRLCFTHLPVELLPDSIINGKCKLIYVARNPKDNAVSFYHFHRMARFLGCQQTTWNEFFALYLSGSIYCGSWFEHVLGYWQLTNSPNHKHRMMFCKFEEMKDDLPKEISRIADFMEIDLTDEQKKRVLDHCTFDSMKNNKMANRDTVWLFNQKISKFMRKGQVGDWRNYFTFAQSEAFDEIYKKKMENTGLDFRFE